MISAKPLLSTPVSRVPFRYKRRKISRVCKSYYTIDENNTTPLSETNRSDLFHIITFHCPDKEEGVYAVRKLNKDGLPINYIVAWRNFDDAFRYKTLLDAEMDYSSYIQFASRFELDHMCEIGNYACRVVNDNVLVTPPGETIKTTDWERRSDLLNGKWSVREKNEDPPEWP
jgi:hypothetical protein|tara:strand:+ start:36 stop:551 length:516 start_codon:yes stop_codon:yes gene_type:complete